MKGLYFYKLVSPYSEDVTKDCKLTVNEIDHNFITLKDVDIKNAQFNEIDKTLVIERNDGDTIDVDLSSMVEGITTNLDVDYDKAAGTITISYNGQRAVIDGLITKENLAEEVLTEVVSDGTLEGKGRDGSPLGVSPVEQTGTYRPAIRLLDLTNGELMPKPKYLTKGDRYLTHENVSDYGYLYDFRSAKRINEDLCNGWRIPTKTDWDNMLNAIEPCPEFRNHNSIIGNQVLGKIAGKLLKSRTKWDETDGYLIYDEEVGSCKRNDVEVDDDAFDVEITSCGCPTHPTHPTPPNHPCHPKPRPKKISPNGVDAYGMRLLPAGYGDGCQVMDYFGKRGAYWTSTMSHVTDVYIKRFDYNKAGVVQSIESPQALFSIRLVKDFDGSNHRDVEYINGVNYTTKLLPSLNTKHGHSIWTSMNAAFTNDKYRPVEPNGGMDLTYRKVYYINEWNGFNWIKKQMLEGESIVLLNGLCCEKNIEYRIVKGELVSVANIIYSDIIQEIKPEIDRIDGELTNLRERTDIIEERVDDLEIASSRLDEKINQEIDDRIAGDTQLWDNLNEEITKREDADNQIYEDLHKEASIREQVDTQLWDALNHEIGVREDVEAQLWTAINNESALREDVDMQLWTAINNESAIRERIDNEQWEAINRERDERKDADEALGERIDEVIEGHETSVTELKELIEQEALFREMMDDSLQGNIDNESSIREADDKVLEQKITDEAIARQESDSALDEVIHAEIADRKEADEALGVRIDEEATAREEADVALGERIDDVLEGHEGSVTELKGLIEAEADARKEADDALDTRIDNEKIYRKEADDALGVRIDEEATARENADRALDEVIHAEIARSTEKDQYLEDRLIVEEGSEYDCANGTLTLTTKNPENTIEIKLTGNYGTF